MFDNMYGRVAFLVLTVVSLVVIIPNWIRNPDGVYFFIGNLALNGVLMIRWILPDLKRFRLWWITD